MDAKLSEVMDFFNPKQENGKRAMGISAFNNEWKELTPESQAEIKVGLGNGSMTY